MTQPNENHYRVIASFKTKALAKEHAAALQERATGTVTYTVHKG